MKILFCILIGYIIGSVNPAYILSKIKGFDIRKEGSGNAGASNVTLVVGKLAGVACALLDIGKACLAVWITETLFEGFSLAFAITASACILGHIFPFYMRFRGGKGLACLGGAILIFDWRLFLIMLSAELVIVLVFKYICFVPMTASVAFAVIYGILRADVWGALMLLVVSAVILFKHRENIVRIRQGTEVRFSALWNKEKEVERVKKNAEKNA